VIGEGRFRICEVKEGVYEVLFAENLVDDLCESLLVQLQEFSSALTLHVSENCTSETRPEWSSPFRVGFTVSLARRPIAVFDFCKADVFGAFDAAADAKAAIPVSIVSRAGLNSSHASFGSPMAVALSDPMKFINISFISDWWSWLIVDMYIYLPVSPILKRRQGC